MSPQARLNPEAPSFVPEPYQHHKLLGQPISWSGFATPHYSPPPLFTLQTYVPTLTHPPLTPTSPFHHDTIHYQLNTSITLSPPPTEPDEEPARSEEKEVKVGFEKGGSKGAAVAPIKQVQQGISGGAVKMNGGDGFLMRTLQRFVWKKKGAIPDGNDEERQKYRRECLIRSRQFSRRKDQIFNAFTEKKRVGVPVVPVREDGEETTVMIKNIPAKYSRDKLVDFLDKHCMQENSKDDGKNGDEGVVMAFDFVYLPIDFISGLNKGYAFVNFTSPKAAWKFNVTASNKKWDLFQSHKVREVVAARLQGKEKLQRHFETMNFPCEYEEFLPVFFATPRDGVIKGEARTVGRLLRHRQL